MVLVSADDEDQRAGGLRAAGLRFDGPAFIKGATTWRFHRRARSRWKGSPPVPVDGRGTCSKSWHGLVTYDDLARRRRACWTRARSLKEHKRRRQRSPNAEERTMKLVSLVAVAIVAGAAGAWAAESKGGLALGTKAPDAAAKTKMKNVDGKMLSIADVAGKSGTLVVFTCNHCPFAKDWEQRIVELANTYAGKGIGVVLVNANDPTTHPEDGYEEMQTARRAAA
jgi:hypothetical protein